MKYCLTILATVLAAFSNAATPFCTPRLEKISKVLNLTLPEKLQANVVKDSISTFKGRTIYLRTNEFGDVSQIGYRLFSKSMRDNYSNSPCFDFFERYLLELDLRLDGKEPALRMDIDQIVVIKGSLQMLYSLMDASSVSFEQEEIPNKMYRTTWTIDGSELKITFPMDSQLLLGGNIIDLEKMFKRDVQRFLSISGDAIINDWYSSKVNRIKDDLVIDGGYYQIEAISGDLYLSNRYNHRNLICSRNSPIKSVSNIMLTGISNKDIPMKLALKMYGNKTDTIDITLQQYIAYCKNDNCKLYFGTKVLTDSTLTGTLFAYNDRYAYTHMLSVVFPLDILDGGDNPLLGTAYIFIPLHDITEKYLMEPKEYKKQ